MMGMCQRKSTIFTSYNFVLIREEVAEGWAMSVFWKHLPITDDYEIKVDYSENISMLNYHDPLDS